MPRLLPLVVVLDLALLAACAVDFVRTPAPARFDVRRSVPARVGLSQTFARLVRISGGERARGLAVRLHEQFPPECAVVARTIGAEQHGAPLAGDPTGGPDEGVMGSRPLDLVRNYRSRLRGVQRLGDMRLRVVGPLGLVQRQARFYGEQEFAVAPALIGLKRTLALAASERWRDLGVRQLRRRGASLEFESMRDYVSGDDVRALDWKAYAKRGRPMVRQYEEERGQELILLVDRGRRMAVTADDDEDGGWTKLDHALDAALELCAVALERGDRVGIAVFDLRLARYVQPAKGTGQFMRLERAVFDVRPELVESSLAGALRELGVRHRKRATLVVISDVADPHSLARQRQALRAAEHHHRVVFAGLDDPQVRRAAADDAPAGVRAVALGARADRRAALAELARSGARVVDSLPAETAGPLLAAWLDARRRG